jgi:hypothetical protein
MALKQKNLEHSSFDFKKVELSDKSFLSEFTPLTRFVSCEYNFANLAIWGELYDIAWTSFMDAPLINIGRDDSFLFPHLPQVSPAILNELSMRMIDDGFSGRITQVPCEFVDAHSELADFFLIEPDADFADYVYDSNSLATLAGGALSKKRNLIAQFKREYGECDSRELEKSDYDACVALAESLIAADSPRSMREELIALRRAFELFEALDLSGNGVFLGDRLIGFALTSAHMDGTCCVHFEKASREVKGAAQVINQKTAERLALHYEFINREQDLGLPGLRRAKKSYKPSKILLNYNLSPIS